MLAQVEGPELGKGLHPPMVHGCERVAVPLDLRAHEARPQARNASVAPRSPPPPLPRDGPAAHAGRADDDPAAVGPWWRRGRRHGSGGGTSRVDRLTDGE